MKKNEFMFVLGCVFCSYGFDGHGWCWFVGLSLIIGAIIHTEA